MGRRAKGEGALFKRQFHNAKCPPPEPVEKPDGRTVMKRPKHKGCKETWVGVIDRGRGKVPKYVYGATREDARNKLNEERERLAKFGDIPTAQTKLHAWLTYWIKEIAPTKLKPSTLPTYRTAVNRHIVPFIDDKKLPLSVGDVRAWHKALRSAEKVANRGRTDKKGYAIGTIQSAHGVLSSALDDAIAEGIISYNACKKLTPSGVSQIRGHLTTDQARQLLAANAGDRLGTRWTFGLLSGCRQGERLGLRWNYVDLEAGVADISWQSQRLTYAHGCEENEPDVWECGKARAGSCPQRHLAVPEGWEHEVLHGALVLMRPKGKTPRLVPLIPSEVAALRARKALYAKERRKYAIDHQLVWCQENGQPIDRRDDYDDWQDALKVAGLPAMPLHCMRHTTPTLLDELGVDEKTVQQILGHSRVTTTRAYTHADLSKPMAALELLGEALGLEE